MIQMFRTNPFDTKKELDLIRCILRDYDKRFYTDAFIFNIYQKTEIFRTMATVNIISLTEDGKRDADEDMEIINAIFKKYTEVP